MNSGTGAQFASRQVSERPGFEANWAPVPEFVWRVSAKKSGLFPGGFADHRADDRADRTGDDRAGDRARGGALFCIVASSGKAQGGRRGRKNGH